MSKPKLSSQQQLIFVACLAFFVVIALVLKTLLGFEGVMSSAIFGAVGGGVGGAVGQLLARSLFR